MNATLEEANRKMRQAVEERLAATPPGDDKLIGYKLDQGDPEQAGCCEGGRCHPLTSEELDSLTPLLMASQTQPAVGPPPAEQLLLDALAVIRDRRPTYGGPLVHFRRTVGMINAAFGDVLRRPLTEADWAQIMILDKIARFRGPRPTSDGPVDLAGYAACLAECSRG